MEQFKALKKIRTTSNIHSLEAIWECLVSLSMLISLRTDGSVDRIQIHNNHLQAKVTHQEGSSSLYFLGFGESEDRGAKGYLATMKEACKPLSWYDVFSRMSSFVTDGGDMNTGAQNGLWHSVIMKELNQASSCPFLKSGVLATL